MGSSMQGVSQALMRAWKGQGGWGQMLVMALLPVSWLLRLLVCLRRNLYQTGVLPQQHLPVPVIVVGNVMVGGVGKTPLTMALVHYLKAQGLRVGVLSRGYGRTSSGIQAVTPSSTADEVGDEPLLIARNCQVPVYVGAHRVQAGRALLSKHPEVQIVVCDDGLQHWQLGRDLEICVFDERHVGNAHLLPAGPLREPWPRQAWRHPATQAPIPCLVVNTAGNAGPNEFNVHRSLADFALQADGTQRPLSSWRGAAVSGLAGIAKPEVFFAMLRAKGLSLSHTSSLPDHADLPTLARHAMQEGDVLCTEKDAVKLWPHHPGVWAVPLQTELPPELRQAIDTHLLATSHPKLSSPHGQQTA